MVNKARSAPFAVADHLDSPEMAAEYLTTQGGTGQTMALDPDSGTLYLAWARQVPGEGGEPIMQAVLARSTDGGQTFSEPVVVSAPAHTEMYASTANPVVVEVGPEGTVYVVYTSKVDSKIAPFGLSRPQFVRSTDGGKTWSAPVQIVTAETEGIPAQFASFYMNGLLVTADGDLFYPFLDGRDYLAAKVKGKLAAQQLRVARSTDGGRSWAPSTLVAQPTCACCGTAMAKSPKGVLFVSNRSSYQLEGSYDTVRDPIIARSTSGGKSWSAPVKISDDNFKISGCPDVAMGLAADSEGTLYAAWYTGTSAHPGVYYATSKDGVHWSTPVALLHKEWVPYGDVRLAIDGKGRPWIAFEDRSGEIDRVQVARINPKTGTVSFSKALPGNGPALVAGKDWALLTFEANPAEDKKGLAALKAVRLTGTNS